MKINVFQLFSIFLKVFEMFERRQGDPYMIAIINFKTASLIRNNCVHQSTCLFEVVNTAKKKEKVKSGDNQVKRSSMGLANCSLFS